MNSKAIRHLLLGAFGVFALGAVLPLACASPEADIPGGPGTGGAVVGDASPDAKEAGTGGTSGTGGSSGSGGTAGSGGYGGGTGGTGGYGGGTGGSGGYGTGGYGGGTGGYGGSTGGYSGGGSGGGTSGSGGSMAYSGSQLQPESECKDGQVFLFGECRF